MRTIVLSDGGLGSLVACAMAREAAALESPGDRRRRPMVLAMVGAGATRELRLRAVATQAELLGLDVPSPALVERASHAGESGGERESVQLVTAVSIAARHGCEVVCWPIRCVDRNGGVDLDGIARCVGKGLLAARMVALDAGEHQTPGVRVDTPMVDLDDRQLGELAVEMDVPMRAVWWHGVGDRGDATAVAERDRWMGVLWAMGWSAEPAIGAERR